MVSLVVVILFSSRCCFKIGDASGGWVAAVNASPLGVR